MSGKTAALNAERWFVVNTDYRAERLAKSHLQRVPGLGVYLPMRAAAAKSKTATVPFLPGYLFVRPDVDAPRWNEIYTSLGVRAVLGIGGKPTPAPPALVPRIRAHEIEGVVQVAVKRGADKPLPFKAGDIVRIKAHPHFTGFEALFQCGDAQRILVLVSLFGRQTRVELTAEQLAPICDLNAVDG